MRDWLRSAAEWLIMEMKDCFDYFCNGLALVYHESRNVRHLIRQGLLDETMWRFIVSLPTNRDEAWRQVSPLRDKALESRSVEAALRLFEERFRVSLEDLSEMLANEHWRHTKNYGGNAWANIVRLVIDLGTALRNSEESAAAELASQIKNARHNTGSVYEKLERLERSRSEPRL
jgi:hypothetical protein